MSSIMFTLSEHGRFERLLDDAGAPEHLRLAWSFTTAIFVTPDALAMMSALAGAIDEAGPADFGVMGQSRVPWRHVPSLLVYPHPHDTVTEVDELERDASVASTWLVPAGMDKVKRASPSGDAMVPTDADVGIVTAYSRLEADTNELALDLLPWADQGVKLMPPPRIGRHLASTAQLWALTRLFTSGHVVLALFDGINELERRTFDASGVAVKAIRPTHAGEAVDGFVPAQMRDRQHFTADGLLKRALSAEQAADIVANDATLRWYVCDVCNSIHVGHRTITL